MLYGQTAKLTQVSGTNYSMLPPTDFIKATTFNGFQNIEKGASIMLNELEASYQSLADGFTADALKTRGMTLLSKKTIDFNNSKATLLAVKQTVNGIPYLKKMLLFGDTEKTVLINGIYPEVSKEMEDEIEDAMLSTSYSKGKDENMDDATNFTIDIKDTEFKFIKNLSQSLLYSTDGKIPTEKPILIVGQSIAKVNVQSQKQYAAERIKKIPGGEQVNIKQNTAIAINDLNGYEIIAEGKTQDNKPELLYQVMLFNDQGDYFIIFGQAREEFEKNLETYKKIAKSFKQQ